MHFCQNLQSNNAVDLAQQGLIN